MKGKVYLVGCGTGDPELLTIKALKAFETADIAFIDHLVTDDIVYLLPKSTKKFYVGKQKDKSSITQSQINRLMYIFAKEGFNVARLKSGDPFVFGRGGEELLYLLSKEIEVEIIPGVSSATTAPLYAGIPVTFRNISTGFSVVSAYLSGNRFNKQWIPLLKLKNHTVVVLMGLSKVKEIVIEIKKQNIPLETPVAVISKASRPDQKIHVGTVTSLIEMSKKTDKPAVLVFGDTVRINHLLSNTTNKGELIWKN
ncbi:MAG: uroporphyrinogen-III C-methyltransferase [Aquificae bacterium]|nr:uroporphyrinogen-III C-methyltransferase [Aquificota bacterium]